MHAKNKENIFPMSIADRRRNGYNNKKSSGSKDSNKN